MSLSRFRLDFFFFLSAVVLSTLVCFQLGELTEVIIPFLL